MVAPLQTLGMVAPGIRGLNRQVSGTVLGPDWAFDAKNTVIDKTGRLASRKGWTPVSAAIGGTPDVEQVFEYLNSTGAATLVSATASNLYSGTASLTSRTGALTPSAGNWKFQNFNGVVVGWQAGHAPIYWNGTGDFAAITPSAGTVPDGNEVLAAYGRLWAVDDDSLTIKFSDLLSYTAWSGGSAGQIDLRTVWSYGMDYVTALAAFNGFLVIFGNDSIIVYQTPYDPTEMSIVEVIRGVGCIARDSVQIIGNDIWFLSRKGVQSLGRVIQEKSMPMNDVSKNVRDWMLDYLDTEDVDLIRSVYDPINGFYLLTIPSSSITVCFDTRSQMEDGSARSTYWDLVPSGMCLSQDKTLYFGMPGYVAKYFGYLDNASTYRYIYTSPWMEMSPDMPVLKMLKQLVAIISIESSQDVVFKWAFDFETNTYSFTKEFTGDSSSEWGVGEWGEAEFGGASTLRIVTIPTKGQGRLIQVYVEADISGAALALQRLDLQAKHGRLS